MDFKYLGIQNIASEQIERLLTSNIIGTPGVSMLYQHLGVEQKLHTIAKPHFVTISRMGRIMGTCCFCERDFKDAIGFYVRYFAFKESYRLKGAPLLKDRMKTSAIRTEIRSLLNDNTFLTRAAPFFYYAYVDPRNPRSANVCEEFGFIPIRKYTTRLFSRIFPHSFAEITIKEIPSASEKIKKLLATFYADYNHFSFENLDKTYCYVEDETGQVIAGVQVNPDAWRVLTLPGKYGRLLLSIFHHTPLLCRLLAKRFEFLAVEGMYCKAGQETVLKKLLETLLHRHQLHTALIVVDTDSSLSALTQKMKMGLLAKLSPEVYGNVIARYQGVSEAFIHLQKSTPSYISVKDLS